MVRYSSQPMSKRPLNFSIHAFGTWSGACAAPGAKYMKSGRFGAIAFCWRIHARARVARSSLSV